MARIRILLCTVVFGFLGEVGGKDEMSTVNLCSQAKTIDGINSWRIETTGGETTNQSCSCTITVREETQISFKTMMLMKHPGEQVMCQPYILLQTLNDTGTYAICATNGDRWQHRSMRHMTQGESLTVHLNNPNNYAVEGYIEAQAHGASVDVECNMASSISQSFCPCIPPSPDIERDYSGIPLKRNLMTGFLSALAFLLICGGAILLYFLIKRRKKRNEEKSFGGGGASDNPVFMSDQSGLSDYAEIHGGNIKQIPISHDPQLKLDLQKPDDPGYASIQTPDQGSKDSGLYSQLSEVRDTRAGAAEGQYADVEPVAMTSPKVPPHTPDSYSDAPPHTPLTPAQIEELYARPNKTRRQSQDTNLSGSADLGHIGGALSSSGNIYFDPASHTVSQHSLNMSKCSTETEV